MYTAPTLSGRPYEARNVETNRVVEIFEDYNEMARWVQDAPDTSQLKIVRDSATRERQIASDRAAGVRIARAWHDLDWAN